MKTVLPDAAGGLVDVLDNKNKIQFLRVDLLKVYFSIHAYILDM